MVLLFLFFLFLLSFLGAFGVTAYQVVVLLAAHDPYGAAAWGVGGLAVTLVLRAFARGIYEGLKKEYGIK
jgi:hypothetical protein